MIINVVLTERIDGVNYSYKDTSIIYSSYFNRIRKLRDGYRIYCIPISDYSEEWDNDGMSQYILYKLGTSIYDSLLLSGKICYSEFQDCLSNHIVESLRKYEGRNEFNI